MSKTNLQHFAVDLTKLNTETQEAYEYFNHKYPHIGMRLIQESYGEAFCDHLNDVGQSQFLSEHTDYVIKLDVIHFSDLAITYLRWKLNQFVKEGILNEGLIKPELINPIKKYCFAIDSLKLAEAMIYGVTNK